MAVHLQPDILLADEILAVGDQVFQDKCLAKIAEMRKNGMSLVLVSHSQEQVETFCENYIKLNRGVTVEHGTVKINKTILTYPAIRIKK